MLEHMLTARLVTLAALIASVYAISVILSQRFLISFGESVSLTISVLMLIMSTCTACIGHLNIIIYMAVIVVVAQLILHYGASDLRGVLRLSSIRTYIAHLARIRSRLLPIAILVLLIHTYLLAQAKYGYYPSDEWIAVGTAKAVIRGNLGEYVNSTRYFTLYGFLLAGLNQITGLDTIAIDMVIAVTVVLPLLYTIYLSIYRHIAQSVHYASIAVALTLLSGGLVGILHMSGTIQNYTDYMRFSNMLNDGYRGDFFITTGIWTLKTLGIALALSAALTAHRAALALHARQPIRTLVYTLVAALVSLIATQTYLPSLAYFMLTYPVLAAIGMLGLRIHALVLSLISIIYLLLDTLTTNNVWKAFLATKIALVQAPIIVPAPSTLSIVLSVAMYIMTILLITSAIYIAKLANRRSKAMLVLLLAAAAISSTLSALYPATQQKLVTMLYNYTIAIARYLPLLLAAIVLLATRYSSNASTALVMFLIYTLVISVAPIPDVVKPRLYLASKLLLAVSIITLLRDNKSKLAKTVTVLFLLLGVASFMTFVEYSIMHGVDSNKSRDAISLAYKLGSMADNVDMAIVCVKDWIAERMALWLLGITPVENCAGLVQLEGPVLIITSKPVGKILDNGSAVCSNTYCTIVPSTYKNIANTRTIILQGDPKHIELRTAMKNIGLCVSTPMRSGGRGDVLILLGPSSYIRVLRSSQYSQHVNIYDCSKVESIQSAIPYQDRILTIVAVHEDSIIVLTKDELKIIKARKGFSNMLTIKALFKTVPEKVKWKPYSDEAYAAILICEDCTALDRLLALARLCGQQHS